MRNIRRKIRRTRRKGKGWWGEPIRHSLASKGIKTINPSNKATKSIYFTQKGFNALIKKNQKGLIIDLAKKAFAGVKHALQWEKEHLPKQAEWVKQEYHEAKNAIQNLIQQAKKGETVSIPKNKQWLSQLWKEAGEDLNTFIQKLKEIPTPQLDQKEVKDEMDTDEDGTPDISPEEFQKTNQQIRYTFTAQTPQKTSLLKKIKQKKKQIEQRQKQKAKELIDEVGTQKEKAIIKKIKQDPDADINLAALSDKTLEELAVRTKSGLFGNRYENELIRRMKERERIKQEKLRIAEENKRKRKELRKQLKQKKEEKGLLADLFG